MGRKKDTMTHMMPHFKNICGSPLTFVRLDQHSMHMKPQPAAVLYMYFNVFKDYLLTTVTVNSASE